MLRRNAVRSLALGFTALRNFSLHGAESPAAGYGPLLKDPKGLLGLPAGFSYKAISRVGETMSDKFRVPALHDGMACFATADPKRVVVVRNHELNDTDPARGPYAHDPSLFKSLPPALIYDRGVGERPAIGGTTNLLYNLATRTLERHHLSLTGTVRNCAGGRTPWGTWITCEETTATPDVNPLFAREHGYNFEVPASAKGLVTPIPLKAMGRFAHEAVAVHERSGIVYQTEDTSNSLIYRFIPAKPGDLTKGKLQALALRGRKTYDTRIDMPVGEVFDTEWIDLDEVESPNSDLRLRGAAQGAAVFSRGEGAWASPEAIWLVCTTGGRAKKGQIFRYIPSPYEGLNAERKYPGRLELFLEPNDATRLDNPDNLCAAPWGDLFLSEDGPGPNGVVGFTLDGVLFPFAVNELNAGELAGPCFSPDGSTLFVNIQNPGITFAITGPWKKSA